ncbi:ATP-binding protein [Candidatus Pyrohabitans sp.]
MPEIPRTLAERIVELSADAVLLLNSKGEVVYSMCSPSFSFSSKIRGRPLLELWLPELRQEGEKLIREARKGRVLKDRVTGWTSPAREPMVVSLSMGPLDKKNPERGVVVIVRDITREAEAEEKVSRYIRELVEYVKHVERSNQLKDTFADIMRHDLLNPLSAIKSVVSTGSVGEEGIELINKSVNRIEKIVSTFSRYALLHSLEELDFHKENLARVLDEVVDTLTPAAEEKGIRIMKKYPSRINAHFSHFLEEAVVNLLSNAIKFSDPGDVVTLEVTVKEDHLNIMVKDQGIGVPDRYKKSIFERFVRGKKEGILGSGLGLAIVKRIAELHNGRVWVEDNLVECQDKSGRVFQKKQGSIFVLRIPRGRKK